MGRECRRVRPGWTAPKNDTGHKQPQYDKPYRDAVAEWKAEYEAWERGERPSYFKPESYPDGIEFWDYNGMPPDKSYYRPDWKDEERTHYQMYETCTEGTPISPAFATPEEVARWCVDNGASAFANMTATYEQWLAVANGAWAPSMVVTPGVGIKSGVEAAQEPKP
jgi:hypothetical protein